jgi:hypothetical protein
MSKCQICQKEICKNINSCIRKSQQREIDFILFDLHSKGDN